MKVVHIFLLLSLAACGVAQPPMFPEDQPFSQRAFDVLDANDIRQGEAGDCWYLATLGALIRSSPEEMASAITTDGNDYVVRFYGATDEPQYVKVTKDFLNEKGARLAVRYPQKWPAIFERAVARYMAKANNKPANEVLDGGQPSYAFRFLQRRELRSVFEPSWQDFYKHVDASQPTVLCTYANANVDVLQSGHCYWLESMTADTLTLRNPWGVTVTVPGNDKLIESFVFQNYVEM